jgi:hypothetical protein
MGAASAKVYVPTEKDVANGKVKKSAVDTNVVCIAFSILKDSQDMLALGDPIFCGKCGSILNVYSSIQPLEEKIQSAGPDQIAEVNGNLKKWCCEFCGKENLIMVEKEELPQKGDIIYLLQSAAKNTDTGSTEESKDSNDYSLILCLDNSGSMTSTSEVQGGLDVDNSISEEEMKMLAQFIEPGANQFMYQKQNVKYISRKQALQVSMETFLKEQLKNDPNSKVGLITFDDSVLLIGDCIQNPVTIAGDKLNNYDICLKCGEEEATNLLNKPLNQVCDNLISKFSKLNPSGKTALGPALLSAVGLASKGNPGSRIIICTDGLANVGLGSLESIHLNEARAFYEKLGELAKEKGVSISIVTIKGEGSNVEIIGKLADVTNGTVTRVDMNDIEKQFSNLVKDEILASKVELTTILHQGLKYRNEEPQNISHDGTKCFKNIGNVTSKTQTTFEFDVKTHEEMKQSEIDVAKLKEIPLQAHITYYDMKGNKYVRVITRMQKVSNDKEDVEKDVNFSVLATHAVKANSKLALDGKMKEAQNKAQEWEDYMVNNLGSQANNAEKEKLVNFKEQNSQLMLAIKSQEEVLSKPDLDKEFQLDRCDTFQTAMYNFKQQ